jgi:hypothetical protein
MKVLVVATSSFAAVIGPAMAQQVPGQGPMVPTSPPPLPTHVILFTAPEDAKEHACDQGSIQSLSAVRVVGEKNVPVVFLDQAKQPVEDNTPTSAYSFRFAQQSKDDVRVTMFCGG